jgi:hypothetical protein
MVSIQELLSLVNDLSIKEMMPEVLEDDGVMNVVNKVFEKLRLKIFYNIKRRLPQQPMQVWKEFNGITHIGIAKVSNDSPVVFSVSNDGMFPVQPIITIDPDCCLCAFETPIIISDGTNQLVYTGDICGKLTFYPNGLVLLDDEHTMDANLTTGDFPVIGKGNHNITISFTPLANSDVESTFTVDFDVYDKWSYFVRGLTDEEHPLKSLKLCNEDGGVIAETKWRETDKKISAIITTEHLVLEKFYGEVEFHGYDGSVKVGFPQVASLPETATEDELIYLKNDRLEQTVKDYGMFRRIYKTEILPRELLTTYPIGYEYPIEQDYWLEKRFIEEYSQRYNEYGLLRSEIYNYLGVIPEVKKLIDYCLIYDEREWDQYVWGGDDFMPAVMQVRIPVDAIPSNFNQLTNDELQAICDRCKPFGTKCIPLYSINKSVRVGVGASPGGSDDG